MIFWTLYSNNATITTEQILHTTKLTFHHANDTSYINTVHATTLQNPVMYSMGKLINRMKTWPKAMCTIWNHKQFERVTSNALVLSLEIYVTHSCLIFNKAFKLSIGQPKANFGCRKYFFIVWMKVTHKRGTIAFHATATVNIYFKFWMLSNDLFLCMFHWWMMVHTIVSIPVLKGTFMTISCCSELFNYKYNLLVHWTREKVVVQCTFYSSQTKGQVLNISPDMKQSTFNYPQNVHKDLHRYTVQLYITAQPLYA